MAADDWVLSVDGGGTKTDVLLVNSADRLGIMVTGAGTNPNAHGKVAVDRLEELIFTALKRAEISGGEVGAAVIGMAGLSHPKYRPDFDEMLKRGLPSASICVISDAEMAHRMVWGKERGMTMIVGTGSIAVGDDGKGNFIRAGGLGYQFGDVGSGYWLGKNLITQLIAMERSEDEEVLKLKSAVISHFEAREFEGALEVASGRENIPRVAELSPVVLNYAKRGNNLAEQIVRSGTEGLLDLVEELAEKMGQPERIAFHGSVITESSFYRSLLLNGLGLDHWKQGEKAAVFGGLILAGAVETPEELCKFAIDYG
mgnify:CR=1 FL=1|tara:strand:- start:6850 stop:7791 length:942 start_codon:yes stop_codon:yes gene_type:complete